MCQRPYLQIVVVEVWQDAQVNLSLTEDPSHLSCINPFQPAEHQQKCDGSPCKHTLVLFLQIRRGGGIPYRLVTQ